MSQPGFYNANANRAYPFVPGNVPSYDDRYVVDCGFVLGQDTEFDYATDSVTLAAVRRVGGTIEFDFRYLTDILTFSVDESGGDYQTVFAMSAVAGNPDCPELPRWDGFLVTGEMEALSAIPEGVDITFSGLTVEPANLQSLFGTIVSGVNLLNIDRTREVAADGCPELVWPFTISPTYEIASCLRGNIAFVAGHNAEVIQNSFDNSIEIAAIVGAGEGELCSELPQHTNEAPPTGRTTLDGALRCSEVLRSINGQSNTLFNIQAGTGASIVPAPSTNTVRVVLNMDQLAVCVSEADIEDVFEDVP